MINKIQFNTQTDKISATRITLSNRLDYGIFEGNLEYMPKYSTDKQIIKLIKKQIKRNVRNIFIEKCIFKSNSMKKIISSIETLEDGTFEIAKETNKNFIKQIERYNEKASGL